MPTLTLNECYLFLFLINSIIVFQRNCRIYHETAVLLSKQLAMRVRVGSFVNPKGGAGRNKAADMQQENTIMKLSVSSNHWELGRLIRHWLQHQQLLQL